MKRTPSYIRILLVLSFSLLFVSGLYAVELTVTYTYDSLNRLTSAQYDGSADDTLLSYHYDALGNITEYSIALLGIDSDGDGLPDSLENSVLCLNAYDADTDDDGIIDGVEDANHNGEKDDGETHPCYIDTDYDGIQDGTELGYTTGHATDTNPSIFQPDLDPLTTTDPLDEDSDNDGRLDGEEDANHNGRVDPGETNPGLSDTAEFTEDWETGTIDPIKWDVGGSPTPVIHSGGHNSNYALDHNGDSWCHSAAHTKTWFSTANGLVAEFWLKAYQCPTPGCNWSVIYGGFTEMQLTDNQYCTGENWYDSIAGVAVHSGTEYISYFAADNGTVFSEDYPDYDWHKYKIEINSDGYVSFYRDDQFKGTSDAPIDLTTYSSTKFQVWGQASYGPMLIDDISIKSYRQGKMVFMSNRDGDYDIWIESVYEDGSTGTPVNLTSDMTGICARPRWSPDGSKIAFESRSTGTDQIWVMNSNGSNKIQLTNLDGYYCRRPDWSPDASQIAFYRHFGTGTCAAYRTTQICTMNADGSNMNCIANQGGHGEYWPTWSPLGDKILYDRDEGTCSNPKDIYMMNPDGTDKQPFYPPSGQNNDWNYQMNKDWGSHGKILFEETTGSGTDQHLLIINDDGTGLYDITHPGSEGIIGCCWAFDNNKVIYRANIGEDCHLWMCNADGTNRVQLTFGSSDNSYADFILNLPCLCDLNTDGKCDMQDWLLFGEDWGRTDCGTPQGNGDPPNDCECDLNTDGKCDMEDWLMFGKDWGRTDCPTP